MKGDTEVRVQLEIELDGAFRAVTCRVEEEASTLTHAVVEIATNEDLNFEDAVGTTARLAIFSDGEVVRRWTLLVGSIELTRFAHGSMRYDVHLHARPWLAKHTLDTRKFQEIAANDIVQKVLGKHGVEQQWHLTRAPRTRSFCVQHGESDLDFARRLLELEGIYFTFDEDGVMVLADRSSAAPHVPGARSTFALIDPAGLGWGELGVLEARRAARVAPGRASVNDFNWKKPKTSLLASKAADRDTELDVYNYPEGYREQGEGEVLAGLRLEAYRARAITLEGAANVGSFAPGHAFTFTGSGDSTFAGDYFLVRVEHEARDVGFYAEGASEATPYRNRFVAIPLHVPFRPELKTPQPRLSGTHTAMVRGPAGEEIHTDKHGRLKVQFHWDREATGSDADSRWIRLLQENQSSQHLARVGWEMNIAYIDGDPDRPLAIARKINGAMPPVYAQPSEKNTMTIKTPSSPGKGGFNEIKLRDDTGDMLFYVRAEKDLDTQIKNDKSEDIARDETRNVQRHLRRATGRDQRVTIGRHSRERILGKRSLVVQKARMRTVEENETIHVKEKVTLSTVQNETEKVGSTRLTFTGGFIKPDFKAYAKTALTNLKGSASELLPPLADAAKTAAKGAWEKGGGFDGLLDHPVKLAGSVAGAAVIAATSKLLDAPKKEEEAKAEGEGTATEKNAETKDADAPKQEAKSESTSTTTTTTTTTATATATTTKSGELSFLEKIEAKLTKDDERTDKEDEAQQKEEDAQAKADQAKADEEKKNEEPVGLLESFAKTQGEKALDDLSGGLFKDATIKRAADMFLSGSIQRTATETMKRTIGGAFISAGANDFTVTTGTDQRELIGGLKLTATGEGISQSSKDLTYFTIGAVIRRSVKDTLSSAEITVTNVGAALRLGSSKQVHFKSKAIVVVGLTTLDFDGSGGAIAMTPDSISMTGALQIKAGEKVVVSGSKNDVGK
jgi:type VI secretion system secreted protein VgrG